MVFLEFHHMGSSGLLFLQEESLASQNLENTWMDFLNGQYIFKKRRVSFSVFLNSIY